MPEYALLMWSMSWLICGLHRVLFAVEETSKQLKALLASAANKGITGKALMAAATASMSSSADGAASMPTQDKQLVGNCSRLNAAHR
jgi:hypothetical protein